MAIQHLLPCTISQEFDPEEQMFVTDVTIEDAVHLYSEKTYYTPDGPAGIYLALTHVLAVSAREALRWTDTTPPSKN